MVVLDTNVIIDFLKGKAKAVAAVNQYQSSELAITFVNRYELLKYKHREQLEPAMANLTRYHSSDSAVVASAEAYKRLKANGKLISDNDLLIFGVCVANNETLLTSDKDFRHLHSSRIVIIEKD